ncbi:hypothetical protein [Pseudomonas pseudonitroreducens]|uniref:hypothetical protein n=1 Tax=Pseudomonas pseudonitroreducens TaxID=2892326 RepID=UPI001F3982C8|nr:hypothetical protein [Pseudomonas pseudonitroreducens]
MSDFDSVEDEMKFMADMYDDREDPECSAIFMRALGRMRTLEAEAQALREEVAEYEALCNRQADLLSQSIIAIRGPEPELTRWGYADLPLRVKTLVEEVAGLRAMVVLVPERFIDDDPDRKYYWGGYNACLDDMAELNGNAVSEGLLRTLIGHAKGELKHLNNGMCPDEIEGHDTRDPECSVCQALLGEGKEHE